MLENVTSKVEFNPTTDPSHPASQMGSLARGRHNMGNRPGLVDWLLATGSRQKYQIKQQEGPLVMHHKRSASSRKSVAQSKQWQFTSCTYALALNPACCTRLNDCSPHQLGVTQCSHPDIIRVSCKLLSQAWQAPSQVRSGTRIRGCQSAQALQCKHTSRPTLLPFSPHLEAFLGHN